MPLTPDQLTMIVDLFQQDLTDDELTLPLKALPAYNVDYLVDLLGEYAPNLLWEQIRPALDTIATVLDAEAILRKAQVK